MSDTQIVAENSTTVKPPFSEPMPRMASLDWALWLERKRVYELSDEARAKEESQQKRMAELREKLMHGPMAQARRYLDGLYTKCGMADDASALSQLPWEQQQYYQHLGQLQPLIYTTDTWYAYDHGVWREIKDYDLRAALIERLILQSSVCTETPAINPSFVNAEIDALKGLCGVRVSEQLPYQLSKVDGVGEWVAHKSERIAFENGILCLEQALEGQEGALEPRSADWVTLTKLPYNYDPDASCELWEQTLREIFPSARADDNRIAVMQEFFGWQLTRRINQEKFLLCVGDGANGKTVVLSVNEQFVGRANCAHLGLADISNRFMLGALADKLVNISGDMTHVSRADEGRLKMLVSGNPMTIDRKNKDPILLVPTAKMVFACNTLPSVADKSEGIWRRCIVVPFKETFDGERRDTERAAHIIETELPGIFNWALEGLRRLLAQGHFTECGVVEETKEEYRTDCNSVRRFYGECCSKDEAHSTLVSNAYIEYANWCARSGYKAMAKNTFCKELVKVSKIESSVMGPNNARVRAYKGLRVHSEVAFVNRTDRFAIVGED